MSLKIENVKKEHLKVLQLTEEREGKIGSFSTIISRWSEGEGLISEDKMTTPLKVNVTNVTLL